MLRRQHHPYAMGNSGSWSIGSNGLTAAGQSELLRDLGRHLQMNYQSILKEPAPDRIKQLLERLETPQPRRG
jgi:hypothetical protein